MWELITNPFGFALIWFDVGLLLMILGEYWFTIRKGHKIEVTSNYVITFFGLSLLGILVLNRIIEELFSDNPEFLTHINYKDESVSIKDSYVDTTIEECEIIKV